ncbi:hypothetical protein GRI97_17600 [Altererythrobacter xixiisoli]|uniref:Uncharacterized protein n=1 Tax=Croceibacterium xixiisoli TaxID=1476466 RepID=A0A6I4U1Q3_9SPHN|nr:hypothetical protein [Croceibacterium xixiisoli]
MGASAFLAAEIFANFQAHRVLLGHSTASASFAFRLGLMCRAIINDKHGLFAGSADIAALNMPIRKVIEVAGRLLFAAIFSWPDFLEG